MSKINKVKLNSFNEKMNLNNNFQNYNSVPINNSVDKVNIFEDFGNYVGGALEEAGKTVGGALEEAGKTVGGTLNDVKKIVGGAFDSFRGITRYDDGSSSITMGKLIDENGNVIKNATIIKNVDGSFTIKGEYWEIDEINNSHGLGNCIIKYDKNMRITEKNILDSSGNIKESSIYKYIEGIDSDGKSFTEAETQKFLLDKDNNLSLFEVTKYRDYGDGEPVLVESGRMNTCDYDNNLSSFITFKYGKNGNVVAAEVVDYKGEKHIANVNVNADGDSEIMYEMDGYTVVGYMPRNYNIISHYGKIYKDGSGNIIREETLRGDGYHKSTTEYQKDGTRIQTVYGNATGSDVSRIITYPPEGSEIKKIYTVPWNDKYEAVFYKSGKVIEYNHDTGESKEYASEDEYIRSNL